MLALVVHRRNGCARRELGVAAQFEIKKIKKIQDGGANGERAVPEAGLEWCETRQP